MSGCSSQVLSSCVRSFDILRSASPPSCFPARTRFSISKRFNFLVLVRGRSSCQISYPAILFVEGQEARGVFVICNGRIKLSASSADGKSLILRIAEPGEVVGLPGTISGKPYEVTAEALEPIQANFIPRERLGATDDCGFSPFSIDEKPNHGSPDYAREVAFQKIHNRVEGTRMAAEQLGIGAAVAA